MVAKSHRGERAKYGGLFGLARRYASQQDRVARQLLATLPRVLVHCLGAKSVSLLADASGLGRVWWRLKASRQNSPQLATRSSCNMRPMRATRLLKSRLKARTAPVAKVVTEPEDPMKGFQTAGGGSALLERAGKRYYESERGPFYNPVVTGFVPNEVNR